MRIEAPVLLYFHLPLLALVMARTTAFFVTVPFFSASAIPLPQRGAMALAVALLVYPLRPAPALPGDGLALVLLFGREAAVGLFFGWLVQIFFAALQLGGQLAGFGIGLSLARVIDPGSATEDSLGPALYHYLGLILFLAAGGHRELLRAFLETYRLLPVGAARLDDQTLRSTTLLVGEMLETGLRLAAPVAVLLFLVDLLLTLANRIVPQIPVLMIGMPAKTWLGVAALGWGLAAFAGPAVHWLERAPRLVAAVAHQLAGAP
jgi:flagellar biosynthesis protein FliR